MRRTNVALAVAAAALTPALVFTTPSLAAAAAATPTACQPPTDTFVVTTPVDEMSDDDVRITILRIIADPSTGRGVKAAAQEALEGTIEDQRHFLTTDRWSAQEDDDAVATARTLFLAQQYHYRAVIREADEALDGSPVDWRAFLQTGCRLAQFEDDKVAIAGMLADPTISPAVRAAVEQFFDDPTPEAARYFLEHGQFEI